MATTLTYRPMYITGGDFKTTYDQMRRQHMVDYPVDLALAKKSQDYLQSMRDQRVVAGKGTVEGIKEAGKSAPNPFKDKETQFVHEAQSDFHRQRASSALDMAGSHARNMMEAGETPDMSASNEPCAPSIWDAKPNGDAGIKEALDFHTKLQNEAMLGMCEMLRESAKEDGADIPDTKKKAVLNMNYQSLGNLANLHSEALGKINNFIREQADCADNGANNSFDRDYPANMDTVTGGLPGPPTNINFPF